MKTIAIVNEEPTAASVWRAVAGTMIGDELLDWPPDLFALTEVILERSEAYRFALSPPHAQQWPPERSPSWADAVADAGQRWSAWAEGGAREIPDLLAEEWQALREGALTPLKHLAEGRDWRMCQALLTVHAMADEACAGLGVALDAFAETGCIYRARGRELLASTGSMARIPPDRIRVLPKMHTPPTGTSVRSLSRYACVLGPGVAARWHKMPVRRGRSDTRAGHTNMLLLPWPLQVRESDFRPRDGSVHRPTREPFGYFEFAPCEPLDLDLVDRLLVSARNEVDSIDSVMLPESAVDEDDISNLEGVLDSHGVVSLQTGVRQHRREPGQLPGNWVHIGISPMLERGGPQPSSTGEPWFHIRQNKHHRWTLDEGQIYQYHLGGALHPHIRWWEAIEVPRRSVQFIEMNGLTTVSLVCEDLAQNDNVADVIRSVGPTLVYTPLLDGPQLPSRWAARYASVFADDPGSAVLTLTSFGMVRRSRPNGRDSSAVVALWKDPGRGIREIPLDPGAEAVLLTACVDRATRCSADGRWPVQNGIELFDVGVHQVRASNAGTGPRASRSGNPADPVLNNHDLAILTSWAEAVAEAALTAPQRVQATLANAHKDAPWRAQLGIAEPSRQLSQAIDSLSQSARAVTDAGHDLSIDALLSASPHSADGEAEHNRLAVRVLVSALKARQARQPTEDPGVRGDIIGFVLA